MLQLHSKAEKQQSSKYFLKVYKELDLFVMSFGKVFQILVDLIIYDCWYVVV